MIVSDLNFDEKLLYMYVKYHKEMGQKIILGNYYRLIKAVTSKLIIDNWMQRKRINDALPPEQRHDDIENSIEDLQLSMFQSTVIGCLHEASEAFIVSKCDFIPVEISRIIVLA